MRSDYKVMLSKRRGAQMRGLRPLQPVDARGVRDQTVNSGAKRSSDDRYVELTILTFASASARCSRAT